MCNASLYEESDFNLSDNGTFMGSIPDVRLK